MRRVARVAGGQSHPVDNALSQLANPSDSAISPAVVPFPTQLNTRNDYTGASGLVRYYLHIGTSVSVA